MQRLYVLYDDRCGLCRWARRWAMGQPAFVELVFLAAGSDAANVRFPGLSKPGEPEELVAVGDGGEVYRNESAWIMCLYALEEYREWSLRLARPALRPFARQAFSLVSTRRAAISFWLGLSDHEMAGKLHAVEAPACSVAPAAFQLHTNPAVVAGTEPRDP